MNGNGRLYRSPGDGMIGGVAAGLARYFHFDVNVMRLLFVLAAFFTGGAFILVYVAMWLLIPSPATTASDTGAVVQENLNEISNRFRGQGSTTSSTSTGSPSQPAPGAPNSTYSQSQLPPSPGPASPAVRVNNGPIILIVIGLVLFAMNIGVFSFFRWIHWGGIWPLLLIALGVILLMRRR